MQRKQRRLVCEDAPNKLSQSWNCFSKREKENQCMFSAAIPSHIFTNNIHLCTWFRLSHLSDIFFTFQIHKASQPTHPPAWFSMRVTNVEQNESTAHMLQSQPPQAQVADALSMLESVTESNIPTSCSNCRPRRTKSTTYNYYKGEEGEGGEG